MAIASPPHTAYSMPCSASAEMTASNSSARSIIGLPRQHLAQRLWSVVDRFVEFAGIFAAGLCEVRLAAAFAADDRSEFVDQGVRVDAVEEVLRHGGEQRDFAVRDGAKDDHARFQFRTERVSE